MSAESFWEAVLVSLVCIALTILLHHEVVHRVLRWAARAHAHPRAKTLVAIVAFLVAHNLAVWIFALGYWFGASTLEMGTFARGSIAQVIDYSFFSAEAYTSVGFDARYAPTAGIRMMAGMEAITGLLMIAWSASSTYLVLRASAPRARRRHPHAPHDGAMVELVDR